MKGEERSKAIKQKQINDDEQTDYRNCHCWGCGRHVSELKPFGWLIDELDPTDVHYLWRNIRDHDYKPLDCRECFSLDEEEYFLKHNEKRQ